MMSNAWEDLPPGDYVIGSKKKLVKKPLNAFRHYTRWTDEELKICADFKKTDEEVAAELCRTVIAIAQRRSMIRFCQQHRKVVRPTT
jgi:hypothetical protein